LETVVLHNDWLAKHETERQGQHGWSGKMDNIRIAKKLNQCP
jgi:hypothetical protein